MQHFDGYHNGVLLRNELNDKKHVYISLSLLYPCTVSEGR